MMNGTLYLRVDPGESLCKSILEAPQIISTGVVAILPRRRKSAKDWTPAPESAFGTFPAIRRLRRAGRRMPYDTG